MAHMRPFANCINHFDQKLCLVIRLEPLGFLLTFLRSINLHSLVLVRRNSFDIYHYCLIFISIFIETMASQSEKYLSSKVTRKVHINRRLCIVFIAVLKFHCFESAVFSGGLNFAYFQR